MHNSVDNVLEELPASSLKSSTVLNGIALNLPAYVEDIFELVFLPSDTPASSIVEPGDLPSQPLAIGPVLNAPILNAVELTEGDGVKKVVDISLDISESDIAFQPGDTIGILPCNPTDEVYQLLTHLSLVEKGSLTYTLKLRDSIANRTTAIPPHIPRSSTILHVLQNCLEIRSVPKKLFLRILAQYTSDPLEQRRLEELCSRQGAKEYTQFIVEARTTFMKLLEVFPSCSPPIERLFELLPRLQARPYSIASSPLSGPSLHIIFSLIELPLKNSSHKRQGICTGWLNNISNPKPQRKCINQQLLSLNLNADEGHKPTIPLFFRKSCGFRLPEDPSENLILIGPGTGIAPFIGFLQHRQLQKRDSPDLIFGDIWLFFGCKHPERDFLYKSLLDEFLKNGIISQLFVSFSQYVDPNVTSVKEKYVQDNIRLHSKKFVNQLIEKKSMVYVCGDAVNMAKDVFNQIVAAIKTEKDIPPEEAQKWLNEHKSTGKYLQDIWA